MLKTTDCMAAHSYFVAEVVGVEAEGKVYMLYLCTSCGDAHCREFTVAKPGASLRLMKEEKQKEKK
jgi:hypothetical protein